MSFAAAAGEPGAQLVELLLTMDEEMTGTAPGVAFERLEALVPAVAERTAGGADEQEQARALADVLARRACLRGCSGERPESLLLGPALLCGRVHPHLLAAVYVQVAQWAGLRWEVAAAHGALIPVPCDAAGTPVGPLAAATPRVIAAQDVAFVLLGGLVRAFCRHLDLTQAIRAAELRLHLPVAACCAHRARAELRALAATLN